MSSRQILAFYRQKVEDLQERSKMLSWNRGIVQEAIDIARFAITKCDALERKISDLQGVPPDDHLVEEKVKILFYCYDKDEIEDAMERIGR